MEHCFYGTAVTTGYLTYLKMYYRKYLFQFVIDKFEEHNPDCHDPFDVAASSDFYLNVVLENEAKLSENFVAVTTENISPVLDELTCEIREIEQRQYPLRRFSVLSALIATQTHIQNQDFLGDVFDFMKRRLSETKLFFS